MYWIYLRACAWVDTRARFVAGTPPGGTLLDLGSSDGETLGHIAELRPDLRLFAADSAGTPETRQRLLELGGLVFLQLRDAAEQRRRFGKKAAKLPGLLTLVLNRTNRI